MNRNSYRWALLAGVWLIYFSFGLTIASMAPLVAPMTRDLDIDLALMGGILGAWPLVYIAAASPCGALVDRFGLRASLTVAVALIAASTLLRSVADDALSMFLAVGVFGIGGPLVSIGCPKLVSLWFDDTERGLAVGIYLTGPSVGGILALAATNGVLMPLVDFDWRVVLRIYAAVVLVSAVVWLALSAGPAFRKHHAGDGGGDSQILVVRRLLRLPMVRWVLAMSAGIFLINHGLNNWLPEILRVKGMSAAAAGVWASVPTLVGIVGSLLIPRLAVGPRTIPILIGLFAASLVALLLLQTAPGPSLAGGLVLQGIARSSMMAVAMLTLMRTPGIEPRHMGAAAGLFFTTAEIGGVLGPLSVGAVAQATGGFEAPLLMLAAVAAALLLAAARLQQLTARSDPSHGAGTG